MGALMQVCFHDTKAGYLAPNAGADSQILPGLVAFSVAHEYRLLPSSRPNGEASTD